MPPSFAMRLASGEAKTRLPAACPAPFGFAAAELGAAAPGAAVSLRLGCCGEVQPARSRLSALAPERRNRRRQEP